MKQFIIEVFVTGFAFMIIPIMLGVLLTVVQVVAEWSMKAWIGTLNFFENLSQRGIDK